MFLDLLRQKKVSDKNYQLQNQKETKLIYNQEMNEYLPLTIYL